MSVYLFRLHFLGPVHFGMAGIDLEATQSSLSSDSLISAIVNAFLLLDGPEAAEEVISALSSDKPPFVLSSLFPFGPDKDRADRYAEALVRPLTPPPVGDSETLGRFGKDLKTINYLHPQDFAAWISQRPLAPHEIESVVSRARVFTEGWWKQETRPRVALDRESQNSAVWSQAATWFQREERGKEGEVLTVGSGLYGLVRFHDESWKERLASAFRVLGDTGLGGERTYGFGLFKFGGFETPGDHWREILSGEGRFKVLLSLYYPRQEERKSLAQSLVAWDFVEKRGYVVSGRNATTIKRKRVRMLVEGSVCRRPLRGAMVDVTPENAKGLGIPHRVFRCGLAFLVPDGERI